MITATDPEYPTSRTGTAMFLTDAANHLKIKGQCDYNDHKAAQLLDAKADLLVAEAQIESWEVDLGFNGCQAEEVDEVAMMRLDEPVSEERLAYIDDVVRQSKIADGTLQIEDSSIGGVPCISSQETS